jgi:TM2 domain-containing membrane protein YozV
MDDTLEQTPQAVEPVNVTAVTICSLLIPGLGQLYLGEIGKGLAMFALGVVLFLISPFLIVVVDFYGAWEAYTFAKAKNANRVKQVEVKAQISAGQISAASMVEQFQKLNALAAAELLTPEELAERKGNVIQQLVTKTPTTPVEDFLTTLIPLVKAGGINADEVKQIKALLLR